MEREPLTLFGFPPDEIEPLANSVKTEIKRLIKEETQGGEIAPERLASILPNPAGASACDVLKQACAAVVADLKKTQPVK